MGGGVSVEMVVDGTALGLAHKDFVSIIVARTNPRHHREGVSDAMMERLVGLYSVVFVCVAVADIFAARSP